LQSHPDLAHGYRGLPFGNAPFAEQTEVHMHPQVTEAQEQMLAMGLNLVEGSPVDLLGISRKTSLRTIDLHRAAAKQVAQASRLVVDDVALRHG